MGDPREPHTLSRASRWEAPGTPHSNVSFSLQMNEIEVCPECYLAACQKRDNWFCEPCVSWIPFFGFTFGNSGAFGGYTEMTLSGDLRDETGKL
jgi:hypothetical protein